MYRKKLFRMLTSTKYSKFIKIGEVYSLFFIRNYRA